MKIKIFALSLAFLTLILLTGCDYGEYLENLKLKFIEKITYLFQNDGEDNGDFENGKNQDGENNQHQTDDYLTLFKKSLEDGKLFTLTKRTETDTFQMLEEVYFVGSYIYKFSKTLNNPPNATHKLYLDSGLVYNFNGVTVSADNSVDFLSVKEGILSDLFGESIAWEQKDDGYIYESGNFSYSITKGEKENSLKYQIRYESIDIWSVYTGEIVLYDTLTVHMPTELKVYIKGE